MPRDEHNNILEKHSSEAGEMNVCMLLICESMKKTLYTLYVSLKSNVMQNKRNREVNIFGILKISSKEWISHFKGET